MSHLEDQQRDPQGKNMFKKKNQKSMSLVDYVADPKREDSLIGLQYVVEIKMLDSDKSVVKCNLCSVKGQMATMKEHLVGTNHIKFYMEKHYFSVLQSLKRSCHHKSQLAKLLKDYAKEIERAEEKQSIKMEYVSAADMKKEQENWMAEQQEERSHFHVDQKKLPVLDKRQIALNYSEKFKISSREEASIVLNLTQRLSDQLEKYFLKYRGLNVNVLDSTLPDSISSKSIPEPTNLLTNLHENLHPKNTANQGMKKEMQWHTEEPSSSSVCTPASVNLFDSMPVKLEDTRGVKREAEVSEHASHECDVLAESSASEFQNRKKRLHKEQHNFPTMHSSFSYMNNMGTPKHSPVKVSSSHSSSIAATYTHISVPKETLYAPETFGGQMQIIKDTSENSVSQNTLNDNFSKIGAVQETESLNDGETTKMSDLGAEENTALPGPSSSTSSCSNEPSSERPLSHTQGKTSKTLSPDILQLLKGNDANTVTNILRTLSPFYPALQDVNLEMLAQVLVNTGALD